MLVLVLCGRERERGGDPGVRRLSTAWGGGFRRERAILYLPDVCRRRRGSHRGRVGSTVTDCLARRGRADAGAAYDGCGKVCCSAGAGTQCSRAVRRRLPLFPSTPVSHKPRFRVAEAGGFRSSGFWLCAMRSEASKLAKVGREASKLATVGSFNEAPPGS